MISCLCYYLFFRYNESSSDAYNVLAEADGALANVDGVTADDNRLINSFQGALPLQMAMNTAQLGRTFQVKYSEIN